MGLMYAHKLVFLVLLSTASMFGVGMANRGWYRHQNNTSYTPTPPRTINVGGSANWQFGFNYTVWAFQNGPFYVNDTLVFKYDPPSENNTHPHSVYLFPNIWSFMKCDLSVAQKIADTTDGTGDGFQFVLSKWQPYYFACGQSNGFHCNQGRMRFFVWPMLHHNWYN